MHLKIIHILKVKENEIVSDFYSAAQKTIKAHNISVNPKGELGDQAGVINDKILSMKDKNWIPTLLYIVVGVIGFLIRAIIWQ